MTEILFSTVGDTDEAHRIATSLVAENLAACVNIIPNISSVYKWEGEVEKAAEWLLMIKTTSRASDALTKRLIELHSYDLPEVVRLPVAGGHQPYLDWVAAQTGS